ncbi:MAG: two-component regulator propeller domain-containing protein, partial [Marinoscillum sp.]
LARDNQSLYLGTNDGQLIKLSIDRRELIAKTLNGSISAISDRKLKIFSIYESAQGILWIGTDGDGVYKYLTKDRAFTPIPEGASGGKLSHSIVRSIYLDKTKVYAGTRSGGLNIVGSATTSLLNKTNGLSDNTVLSIAPDQYGNMWLGIDNEGIDMIEAETGDVLHFPEDFINAPEELYFGSVYKIFLDAYGHLWLGTSGYGVVYLDVAKKAKGQYELRAYYTITPNEEFGSHSLKSNIVYAITSEEPNILWFGTRNGGLYRYNSLTRKFTHSLGEGENKRYALSNNDILSLYLDDRNKLWVGTSGGLNKINLSDYSVQQYSQSEGLANNTIHGILEDQMNRLWLSSNNGLFAFTPSSNTFKNFNWTDGLLNYEYTDGAYFQDQENNLLYFGGTKGIDIVDPTKIDTSSTFPRLAMTDFFINNVPVAPGDSSSILQTHIDFQQSITLNYDQNFLTFRFTTLDYWHKQRCTYRYQLSGFDAQWIEIGRQSNINLTNIPPGRYTLLLNNSNENGDWNPQARQLSIIINPPFWATNTAYVMYALLAIAMQIGLIQVSRNRAKK